jgi:TonB-linked SusC/RagA family outer membrane protein
MKKLLKRTYRVRLSSKIDLKMTLTTLFLVLSALSLQSNTIKPDFKKVTVDLKDATVARIFDEIENNTEFRFVYKIDDVDLTRKISLKVINEPIDNVLKKIFVNQNTTFKILDKQIYLTKRKVDKESIPIRTAEKIQFSISGTVSDKDGMPLPGANIVEKGTGNGTQTDFDGRFTIILSDEQATLVVSYIGFSSKEISVNGQSNLSITLNEDTAGLDEVVLVGYGTAKKSDLTSAIASVKGEDLVNRVTTRVDQALQGQLSGVTVQQSSGIPGAAPRIQVRGVGSISGGNNPLYVIDGFVTESADLLSTINPNDIESIEVLKDAASAAIYGSRGANGVVLVTTKKGKSGEVSVSYNTYYGFQAPEKLIDFMNAEEQGAMEIEVRNAMWELEGGNASDPNSVRPANRRIDPEWVSGNYPDYDKQDFLFSNSAPILNHNLSVSGGNEKTRYFTSLDYLDQEGITRNTGYERIALRANLETKALNDKVTFGLNLNPSRGIFTSNGAEGKDSNTNLIIWAGPLVRTDEFYFDFEANQPRNDYSAFYNLHPVTWPSFLAIDNVQPKREQIQINAQSFIDVEIIKGLNFKTSLGVLYDLNKNTTFTGQAAGNGVISRDLASSTELNWLWENTLNYSKTIDKHDFSALVGYTSQKVSFNGFSVTGRGFDNELSETLNNATEISSWDEVANEWSLVSLLGRVNYNYDGRYFLTASIRRDGSSRFGENNKWGVFPSVSGAWRISNESFFPEEGIVSNLKLRFSWGKTGNNRIGNYNSIAGLSTANAVLGTGENLTNGFRVGNLSNPNLGWEKTTAVNYGLDLGLWDNRVSLGLEYYDNTTTDLLFDVPIPLVTGFASQTQNIGSVSNRGFELDLSTVNVSKGSFEWSTRFNFFTNKNEVLEVGPQGTPIITGNGFTNVSYTGVGQPIGAFYMNRQLGIFQNQAEVDASATVGTQGPGDVKLNDFDGDGDIDQDDREFVGQPQPKYNFGITNQFRYKGFDLSILINGSGGNKIWFAQGRYYDRGFTPLGLGLANLANWNNRWRSEANPGDGRTPAILSSVTGGANFAGANGDAPPSTRWLYDGSFWRISNVTLGYSFPRELVSNIGLDKLRVYLTGDNLFLKTDYVGYNPQVHTNNGDNYTVTGYDYGSTPLARTIILGLNVNF